MALGDKYTLLPSSARQSALHSARVSLVPRSCLTLLDWRPLDSHVTRHHLQACLFGEVNLHNIPDVAGQVGSWEGCAVTSSMEVQAAPSFSTKSGRWAASSCAETGLI